MQVRFYIDPAAGVPHFHNHGVNGDEVMEIPEKPGEDRPGHKASRVAVGQTSSGRYLRVIYVPEPETLFVITAYELLGKPLAAYRKRRKKKQQ